MSLIIGWDFDEVLFRSHLSWLNNFNSITNFGLTLEDCYEYNFPTVTNPELRSILYASRTPETYVNVEPYEDAQELAHHLYSKGHYLVCISSDNVPFHKIKQELLNRYFPYMPLVFAKPEHKWNVCDLDILIDDNPASLATYFPSKPWNTKCKPRIDNLRKLIYEFDNYKRYSTVQSSFTNC